MKRTCIAAALSGWATAAAGPVDTYPIHLSSPSHVGDVVALSTTVTRKFAEIWTDPGDAYQPTREAFTATLEGTRTVDAVSPNGRVTGLTAKVGRCTKDGAQLLPAGTTITAQNVQVKTQFKVDGADPGVDLNKVLEVLLYAARPDEPNADDEFGTAKPRKVGDTWPVNTDAIAKSAHLPYPVTGADFQGQATLAEATTSGSETTETVSVTERCQFARRLDRSGASVRDMDMRRTFTFVCPTATAGVDRTSSTFKVHYTVTGPGTLATRDFTNEVTSQTTYADVPGKPPTTAAAPK